MSESEGREHSARSANGAAVGWLMRFSVRSTLMCLVALVGGAVSFMAASDLEVSARRYATMKRIAELNILANDCLLAGNALLFERGRAQISLHKAGVLSDVDRQFIDTQRLLGDQAMIRVLVQLALPVNQNLRGHEPGLRAAWDRLKQERVALERDFAVPLPARDRDQPRRWWVATNILAEHLERLLTEASAVPGADPEFGRLSAVRLLLFQFRDYVGREAERLGSMQAERRPLLRSQVAELYEWRGRANQLWWQLEATGMMVGDAAFSQALDGIRDSFFSRLRPLNDYLLAYGGRSAAASLPVEGYSAVAVSAIASIAPAFERVGQLTAILAEQREHSARSDFRGNALVLCAILCLLMVLLVLVWWRLILPMRQVLQRIQDLGAREKSGAAMRGDEFVAVRHALDLLEETQRLRAEDARLLAESHRHMERLAVTDGLTGLFNRRHFNLTLAQEWARASRNGRSLSLVLLDIDHFKRYNDAYGHQAGDACLIEVAGVLKAHARRSGDCAARYGGEEFALILPELSSAQAGEIAERIRQAVAELALPNSGSDSGIVTVSIGVAARVPGDTMRPEDLLRLADEALYAAKHEGRNRVVSASD